MNIKTPAKAGTMESNDIYVMVKPNDEGGIVIDLESIVMKQFGKQIEKVILNTLKDLGIDNIYVMAKDRGALDCTIQARIETAVKRGM
ncbi:citrate lyase acyl carrier protein [Anaerophilus nitritogenes]|uniref:citrate lyase acyl carrier protein n=1 Tax=Anaerophilus nitritogenes TaxID=2498136 RepID=UPI00101E17A7|nr:citrate lyase acyl carrier protein [Anaerophilus nitritogenes]